MTNTFAPASAKVSGPEGFPAGVVIVANPAAIAALRAGLAAGQGGKSARPRLIELADDAGLPEDALVDARLLVLEVDQSSPASLRRLAEAHKTVPSLPIIAALADADLGTVHAIMRQGVSDVVRIPFDLSELADRAEEALGALPGKGARAPLAPMITVVGSDGGSGGTTVLTHLAAELAQRNAGQRGVCIVDLDLQSGEVAYYLGVAPKVTVAALLGAGERLDAQLLRSAITDGGHGFDIIAAPEAIAPLDDVRDETLLGLLALARQEYDYVLVDLPADWTSWALSVVMASSAVLMVVELSVNSLRQAKRRLDLFDSIGVDPGNVKLLANRVERKIFRSINVDAVRDVLGSDVLVALGDENGRMTAAQDEGKLITDVHRGSKFAAGVKELAQALAAEGR